LAGTNLNQIASWQQQAIKSNNNLSASRKDKTMEIHYRKSKFYKILTPYLASAVAEGFCEGEGASEEEQLTAWQYIWDTGLWRSLQGFYGRTVHNLIENELIRK